MDTIKFYGPPGCGKTTAGVAWVVEQVKQGANPQFVAYVSFTRAACNEARGRVVKGLNDAGVEIYEFELPLCTTIHALALKALGVGGKGWLADDRIREFADQFDYSLKSSARVDSDDPEETVKTAGYDAALFQIWEFARQRRIEDADAAYQAYVDYDPESEFRVAYDRFVQFVEDYEGWKKSNFLRDYTDLLIEVVHTEAQIDCDVCVVDEAQDLTPLMWEAADTLFGGAAKRACLGDADQAIYSFQGCAPELLYGREAQRTILLDHSHRLPERIHALARSVICQNTARIDVPFSACNSADVEARYERPCTDADLLGEATRISHLSDLPFLNGESWMVLVRNWAFLGELAGQIEMMGLPYLVSADNYYTPWHERGPLKAARVMLELSEPGAQVKAGKLSALLAKTRSETKKTPGAWKHGKKTELGKLIEEYPGSLIGLVDLAEYLSDLGLGSIVERDLSLLTGISARDRDAYAAAFLTGTWGKQPWITLSTIHGVKGAEADNVAALMVCTKAPARNLEDPVRRQEEVRLAYVAITRARRRFFALEPQSNWGYAYDVFNL